MNHKLLTKPATADQATRQRSVPDAMLQLHANVEHLQKTVQEVATRLTPVMRSFPTDEANKEPVPVPSTPLVGQIKDESEAILGVINTLNAVLECLEI